MLGGQSVQANRFFRPVALSRAPWRSIYYRGWARTTSLGPQELLVNRVYWWTRVLFWGQQAGEFLTALAVSVLTWRNMAHVHAEQLLPNSQLSLWCLKDLLSLVKRWEKSVWKLFPHAQVQHSLKKKKCFLKNNWLWSSKIVNCWQNKEESVLHSFSHQVFVDSYSGMHNMYTQIDHMFMQPPGKG